MTLSPFLAAWLTNVNEPALKFGLLTLDGAGGAGARADGGGGGAETGGIEADAGSDGGGGGGIEGGAAFGGAR